MKFPHVSLIAVSLILVAAIYLQSFTQRHNKVCAKPKSVPEWLKWNCDMHKAYLLGEMSFNKDSSIVLFKTECSPIDSNRLVSVNIHPDFYTKRR